MGRVRGPSGHRAAACGVWANHRHGIRDSMEGATGPVTPWPVWAVRAGRLESVAASYGLPGAISAHRGGTLALGCRQGWWPEPHLSRHRPGDPLPLRRDQSPAPDTRPPGRTKAPRRGSWCGRRGIVRGRAWRPLPPYSPVIGEAYRVFTGRLTHRGIPADD